MTTEWNLRDCELNNDGIVVINKRRREIWKQHSATYNFLNGNNTESCKVSIKISIPSPTDTSNVLGILNYYFSILYSDNVNKSKCYLYESNITRTHSTSYYKYVPNFDKNIYENCKILNDTADLLNLNDNIFTIKFDKIKRKLKLYVNYKLVFEYESEKLINVNKLYCNITTWYIREPIYIEILNKKINLLTLENIIRMFMVKYDPLVFKSTGKYLGFQLPHGLMK